MSKPSDNASRAFDLGKNVIKIAAVALAAILPFAASYFGYVQGYALVEGMKAAGALAGSGAVAATNTLAITSGLAAAASLVAAPVIGGKVADISDKVLGKAEKAIKQALGLTKDDPAATVDHYHVFKLDNNAADTLGKLSARADFANAQQARTLSAPATAPVIASAPKTPGK